MSLFDWIASLFRRKPPVTPPPDGGTTPPSGTIAELHELHNRERSRLGLQIFSISTQLCTAAQKHASWMASSQRLDHQNDGSPADRIKASGYRATSAAENIAMGYSTPAQVVAGWMASSGHRRNITGDYQHAGYGVADADGRRWWCTVFANPAGMLAHETAYYVEVYPGITGPFILQP